jgi:Single-strand binding protein family
MPDPSRKRPANQPGTRAGHGRRPSSMADFVGFTACPWCFFGMPRCPPSPGSKGRADRSARQQKGQDHDRGQRELRGNLTDDPELRYTEAGIARAMFRLAVSGRREQESSFFTVIVWRDQAEHAAAESLAKGSQVVVVGRLQQRSWTAEDGSARRPSRSWPRSWGRPCGGRRRPRPGPPGARISSQGD